MPLSEHEQRVLEQMEKALHAEDPRLASTLKSKRSGAAPDRRRLALGVLIAIAGLGLVLVGVMMQQVWIGAVGFLSMVLGIFWGVGSGNGGGGKGGKEPGARPKGKGPQKPKNSGGFMERMEQQWDRRREEDR